jgi:hypothetical protein
MGENEMASSARVQWSKDHEACKDGGGGWKLCLQWVRYIYDNGDMQEGYRFIWRRPDGSLQAARGQARIPSLADAQELMNVAVKQSWGHLEGSSENE